jgi:hypothetical protein
MNASAAVNALSALAPEQRPASFRLLMEAGPDAAGTASAEFLKAWLRGRCTNHMCHPCVDA